MVRGYSKKGFEKRKQERAGYSEFFERHIHIIKKEKKMCQECGKRLIGNISEVAHCLPKQYFKSIATDDENVIYLCQEHHNLYDNGSNEKIREMKIFSIITEKFNKLQEKITEKINYKHYERWGA